MPVVDVAVGVVLRDDGAVLLGQRPPGKPYAGWWEFPGGKLETGESVADALARELHEELGLDEVRSTPWVVRGHAYPHATVRLWFRRVRGWRGEPRSTAWTSRHHGHPSPSDRRSGPRSSGPGNNMHRSTARHGARSTPSSRSGHAPTPRGSHAARVDAAR